MREKPVKKINLKKNINICKKKLKIKILYTQINKITNVKISGDMGFKI